MVTNFLQEMTKSYISEVLQGAADMGPRGLVNKSQFNTMQVQNLSVDVISRTTDLAR